MNKLEKAAGHLRNGWCKGAYRKQLPEGEAFCSTGALMQAFNPQLSMSQWMGFEDDYELDGDIIRTLSEVEESNEIRLLAGVIAENHPRGVSEHATFWAYYGDGEYFNAVVKFNDQIAQSSDEVVAMFEKAAIKYDEYAND